MQTMANEEVRHVIYISKPTHFDHLVVENILTKSRAKNPVIGITGSLIYHADLFLQMLEGLTQRYMNCMKQFWPITVTLKLSNCDMEILIVDYFHHGQ